MARIPAADLLNSGIRHHQAGRFAEAEQIYRQVLQTYPKHDMAFHLLGKIAMERKEFDNAADLFRHAIELNSSVSGYHNDLGNALCAQGRFGQGADSYRTALQIQPDFAEAHNNLSIALRELGRLDESISACRKALSIKPDYADALLNLAGVLSETGDFEGAIACCRQAIQIRPTDAVAHSNLGGALRRAGRQDEAIAACRHALELRPAYAEAYNNLGAALEQKGAFDEAVAAYRRAIGIKADYALAHVNLGITLLRLADYASGWAELEWRLKMKQPRFGQPHWKGEQGTGGTLLLHNDEGMGDAIHFVRYAPLVEARGWQVIVQVQSGLAPLFQTNPSLGKIIPMDAPVPEFQQQCPLFNLPLIFLDQPIPAAVPYLIPDPQRVESWKLRLGDPAGKKRVGIVWAGNPKVRDDNTRSLKCEQLARLGRLPGIQFFSLQKGRGQTEAPPGSDWTLLGPLIKDVSDTAAIMSLMDLIITTDTMPAHLAGALGRPVWTMLQYIADFRWLWNRADSLWYPTMRLFRQSSPGDWNSVLDRVTAELAANHG
jgi:tetratricopeptide (TPR) repeat protein